MKTPKCESKYGLGTVTLMPPLGPSDEAFRDASQRTDFQLSFKRADQRRLFDGGEITSGLIDDSYTPGNSTGGEWHTELPDLHTQLAYFREFFAAAVAEATHEAFEWFRVDGKVVVNPHGLNEVALIQDCVEFGRAIFDKYGRALQEIADARPQQPVRD